ncbi:unnamed protein product, partial [Phytomonas sp. Hart1]
MGWGGYLLIFRTSSAYFERKLAGKGETTGVWALVKDFLGAIVATLITATLITPFQVLKTSCQLQGSLTEGQAGWAAAANSPPRGIHLARHFLQPEGRRVMFRGLGPQILITSSTTVHVTLYECFRRNCFTGNRDPSIMEVALGSAIAKGITCSLFNPLEVVRTRMQCVHNHQKPEYVNTRRGLEIIWRNEGIAGLYRGIFTNVARVIPITVASFVLYENFLSVFRNSNRPSITKQQFWVRISEFLRKDDDYRISYDDLVPDYVNFFNESM